ncbi:hypothetical protein SAMN02745121_08843 [Nannocystis exedens]|uniref:Uncharacterized protein n=1 Tax=Nannocystis exedens TaxID=54 RepID=A0A1I2IR02_9BACT|nr:hypothetical protein [Nannocystis exedens]PCC68148.1 hypothetical protein NAEX_01157 [Nannocystis exedens]SFF43487.1 hypothetical protein SAMN02745121_08843 [Nannocystis exedens]
MSISNVTSKQENWQRSAMCVALTIAGAAALLGCSTAEPAINSASWSPPDPPSLPPDWDISDLDGRFVECRPAGGTGAATGANEPPMVTCVPTDSIGGSYQPADPDCFTYGLKTEYLQAICARTFGGDPQDYEANEVQDAYTLVDDYPTFEFDSMELCNVARPFEDFDEVPAATNMLPLNTGHYDQCSRESYCTTLAELIDVYPSLGLEPDPWCNLGPSGDPQADRPWRCVGSTGSACGFVYEDWPYSEEETDRCPYTKPGGRNYCVIAANESAASDLCTKVCLEAHDLYLEEYGTNYRPEGYLDCSVFDGLTMEWVSDVEEECHNRYYDLRIEDPEKNVEPFHFSGDLLFDSGAHASVGSDNLGFIDYSVENCVGHACDITIKNFGLHYAEYAGTFYDAVDAPYPFSVDGIWISLVEPVRGRIAPSSPSSPPVVSFPSEVFWVRLSAGAVALDGTPISTFGSATLPIDEVTGTYNGGVLTLYIGYEAVDATTMNLTLTTF